LHQRPAWRSCGTEQLNTQSQAVRTTAEVRHPEQEFPYLLCGAYEALGKHFVALMVDSKPHRDAWNVPEPLALSLGKKFELEAQMTRAISIRNRR